MKRVSPRSVFWNRLDIHDRKQLELKLEYQPAGNGTKSKYAVDVFLFLPASLNVDAETYPRSNFYADIHNYVRLKTPVLSFDELLESEQSPLVKIERWVAPLDVTGEPELVYWAKLLSCVFRGALRRLVRTVNDHSGKVGGEGSSAEQQSLDRELRHTIECSEKVISRFRSCLQFLFGGGLAEERSRVSLRLVDEYMSLSIEQFLRKAVTDMERMPRTGVYLNLRRELMAAVIREESYRKENQLRSVLSPTGDNEEYLHRIGFLKKFCMNILFLSARHHRAHQGWEEALFATAAGVSTAFAMAVAFLAQRRFPQVSFNFALIAVLGYVMKDRIKDGLRRILSGFASKHLFDRRTLISDPVTKRKVGVCREKVDYGTSAPVPSDITELRRIDDFVTVSQGELSEMVVRYQKQIILNAELLPRVIGGVSGVTDIIRLNIDRLLRDMDDPEYALEYVDLEDLSVGKVRGAKSYQVDLALRFTAEEPEDGRQTLQLVRLVLDRNGIKRMLRLDTDTHRAHSPIRSVQ